MPRIKRKPTSAVFNQLVSTTLKNRETNDCMVKALVILTGLSYEKVNAALLAAGRQPRKGTDWHVTMRALANLGFKLERVPIRERMDIIESYPHPHNNLHHITTRHPVRFRKVWRDKEALLFDVGAHVAAFKDGQLHDWSINKALRVQELYRITPVNGASHD